MRRGRFNTFLGAEASVRRAPCATLNHMPVSRRFTLSHDHRLSFMLAGDGPDTIVLVPGIMQSANRWREAGYTDALEPTHRVVIPDPLGHGASAKPHDPTAYETARLLDHLLAVFDAAQVERAVLWGYSRGGIVASHFAAAHPGRVSALILGGSAAVIGIDPAAIPPVDALAAALETGDWDHVFAVLRIDDPESRARLSDGNDPVALALAAKGTSGTPAPDLSALTGRIFAYAGDAEPHFAAAQVSAARMNISLAAIPGQGNAGTFQEIGLVMPHVRSWLESLK